MDPVTTAIISALGTGAASAVGEKAGTVAYDKLKSVLQRLFGASGDVVQAVEQLEREPESEGSRLILAGQVQNAKANENQEVLDAAQALLEAIEAEPNGSSYVQSIRGKYIAATQGGGTATVHVNRPSDEP